MVLSVITLAATVPLLATSSLQLQESAQKHQKDGPKSEVVNGVETTSYEEKTVKCHLDVKASSRMSEARREMLAGKGVVLRDGKLFLMDVNEVSKTGAHPLTGYFLPYPNRPGDGLVSTINDEKMLNWIYIDRSSYEVKYDVRVETDKQLTAPMNLVNLDSKHEKRVSFLGWEGFVAVEEERDVWALYFDKDDDGLRAKVHGKKVTEVELIRRVVEEPD